MMLDGCWSINHVPHIGSNAEIMALVLDRYALGIELGVFERSDAGPDADCEAMVAVDPGGKALGFATFYEIEDGERLWLHLLWIDEAWRRQGIASELLEEVEMLAEVRGYASVLLGRSESNAAMAALLERAGWAVDQIVHGKTIGDRETRT